MGQEEEDDGGGGGSLAESGSVSRVDQAPNCETRQYYKNRDGDINKEIEVRPRD